MVAPKKAKLGEAEAAYREVMVGLTAKQAELQVRANRVARHRTACMASSAALLCCCMLAIATLCHARESRCCL